ncbi:MAG: hypothetical protein U9N86_05845 [Bacteroidota bacterium]|nr:hypothetical protein [Bacteroidota bacterium]
MQLLDYSCNQAIPCIVLPVSPTHSQEPVYDGERAHRVFKGYIKGQVCMINAKGKVKVTSNGKRVKIKKHKDGSVEFATIEGEVYELISQLGN